MKKEFNYNDIIEYIDNTYDENFQNAKHWSQEHNTTFEELIDRRDLPKRYFQIGEERIIPEPLPPTQEELDEQNSNRVRSIRGEYMAETLNKVDRYEKQKSGLLPTTDTYDTYLNLLKYLQYLRDIPQSENFPNIEVLTFDEWVN